MSLPGIVKGDKTSHGGVVIKGDPTFDLDGKPVADGKTIYVESEKPETVILNYAVQQQIGIRV